MSDEERKEIVQMDHVHVRVDVITLLSERLLLAGCTMASYCFPAWYSSSNFRSVHRFWDGQLALRRVLRETLNSGVSPEELHDAIDAILIELDHLEMHHGHDWYCWWELHFSIRNSSALPEKKQCMTAVREAYHWIQQWWQKRQSRSTREVVPWKTTYIYFVGAHAYMTSHFCQDTLSSIRTHNNEYLKIKSHAESKEDFTKRCDIDVTKQGYWFLAEQYEIRLHYVKHTYRD
jgi:hypothetical protein